MSAEPIDLRTKVAGLPNLDVCEALDDIRAMLTTYIHFSKPEQADALALWIAYTHWFAAGQPFGFVPYALVTSAERQSGKSTVMELAGMLVHDPLDGQDMSAAVVGRQCGGRTLLLDEIDGVYGTRPADDPGANDLRTILNAGFKYDGKYQRLNRQLKIEEFGIFGPKMLAGIGRAVPETVQDRAISIRMERKAHASRLPKLRKRLATPEADALRERLVNAATVLDFVDLADFPDELDGRRQDIWEPLYSLARLAGNGWLERAVTASVVLTKSEPVVSIGVHLLTDLRELFGERGDPDMIATLALIGQPADEHNGVTASGLCGFDESPWATLTRGRPITAFRLANILGEYDIKAERAPAGPHGYGPKGYWRVHFEKAWARYVEADTSDTSDRTYDDRESSTPPRPTVPLWGWNSSRDIEGDGGSLSDSSLSVLSEDDGASDGETVDCEDYANHQSFHRRVVGGWSCSACSPVAVS
jgi:hypothetical protein